MVAPLKTPDDLIKLLEVIEDPYKGNSDFLYYLIDKVRDIMLGTIRKVDYFAMGRKFDKMYILLPMTDCSGGIVLGTRLQHLLEGNTDEKEIATVTIAVCETAKADSVDTVMKELERLRKEAVESGGNAIKVSKI